MAEEAKAQEAENVSESNQTSNTVNTDSTPVKKGGNNTVLILVVSVLVVCCCLLFACIGFFVLAGASEDGEVEITTNTPFDDDDEEGGSEQDANGDSEEGADSGSSSTDGSADMGETIMLDNFDVTVVEANIGSDSAAIELEVTNTTDTSYTFSTLLNLDLMNGDGQSFSRDLFANDFATSLDGLYEPGETRTGGVTFSLDEGYSTDEIYLEVSSLFEDGTKVTIRD